VGAELRNGNERGSGSLVNRTLLAILIRLGILHISIIKAVSGDGPKKR
jgi:hypothetical protein